VRFYLNGGRVADQTLVESKAFAELTQAQIPIPITPRPAEFSALTPKFNAYGLGWFLRDYRGRKVVMHTGGVDGMTALAAFVPDEQLGIVVLSNQETSFVGVSCFHILNLFFGEPQTDWLSVYASWSRNEQDKKKQEQAAPLRVIGTSPSMLLSGYVGKFRDPLYGDVSITLENERLVLRFEHSPCFTADSGRIYIHWRDPLFPKGLVTFPLNSHGKVSEMRFDQPQLLDVDFAELNFVTVAEAEASAVKDENAQG
jgi:hypothetical protein